MIKSKGKIKLLFVLLCLQYLVNAQVAGQWVWLSGDVNATPQSVGLGIADTSNSPGQRYESSWWTDKNGNFWLYGGWWDDGDADMWMYNPTTNLWTWMAGTDNTSNYTPSNFGVKGVPSPLNTPGKRWYGNQHWTDKNGLFWLFSGGGSDITGNIGMMSDLWCFNPNTLEWTWMAGPNTSIPISTVNYGINHLPTSSNFPPPRCENKGQWVDNSNNLWMFGGQGSDSQIYGSAYNDTWMFDPSTNLWTWITGQKGVQANPIPGNNPVACNTYSPFSINDSLYFIMSEYGAYGSLFNGYAPLFRYDISNDNWVSKNSGLQIYQQQINGACSQGYFAHEVEMTAIWEDSCGAWFWGSGNDLWFYSYMANNFTYINGNAEAPSQTTPYYYGTKGVSSSLNLPFAEKGAPCWKDKNGNFWIYTHGTMWRFTPDYNCIPHLCPIINNHLKANFTFNKQDVCAPYQTGFLNTSTMATSFYWNFGDGTSSTVKNPTHSYLIAGSYTVTLKACDSLTCDSTKNVIVVYPTPKANFSYSLSNACLPCQLSVLNLSVNADTNKWYIDNTFISNVTNISQNYTQAYMGGNHTIELITISKHGCSDTLTNSFGVDNQSKAAFDINIQQTCDPFTFYFDNYSQYAQSYTWVIEGIGTFQNTYPSPLQYTSDGYYNITLYTKTSKGCNDTATGKITVDCDSSYMVIPNVFSPNGDGVNNYFKLKVRRYTDFKIMILDRWGKKVFYSEDFNYSWNGKLNNTGQDSDEGTYFYIIEGRNKNNELKEFKGFLELVR